MKVASSKYLDDRRDLLRNLVSILENDFPYVSILGTDVKGKLFQVTTTGISVNDSRWSERGFVLRVHDGTGYFEFSFNEIDSESLNGIVELVKKRVAVFRKAMVKNNLEAAKTPIPEEKEWKLSFNDEVKILPGMLSAEEILGRLSNLKGKAHSLSVEVINVMTLMENVQVSKLFISSKKDLFQSYIWSQGYLYVVTRRGKMTKYSMKGFSGLKGAEILDEMDEYVEKVVENARMLLSAERINPGTYDVICSPDVAGLIAHEAFGHGVEMDMFVKERAKAVEYLGKQVASELVTMHDGAAGVREVSSYAFDDEGCEAKDTVIIDRGILLTGISDVISASILGTEPTGNGKRQSFERKAYARMTNTYFSPGKDDLVEMITSIDYGFLLEDYYSGMEDPKNWGIQCVIAYGREIVKGKLTGRIVSPVMMTGYVPTLLKSISMVSKDFRLSGTGACGKGHKEFVKVSAGGPYIKAKARLG
ncbi:Zn-dependent protease [Mesotoga sp. HF07.pep.5.2.highcov]|uniref:TldD/PmbA family protein n=1 Tax=unclassified Mesotoga TaxID=1184398 RepID=UPI000C187078|nr:MULTISPECIES: TldD/PmbA family protein [unclassified Mesotoga]PIJ63697.1 Zn-dependent protease [Mesotoga sp. H07.pep.5.3]RLL92504.1 Zn-dependent protease [Mesotoga sp. HF07.pep.5.2.highcov]